MERLYSNTLANKKTTSPTQAFLDVAEVKDNTIILKSGTLRSVLAVSAINFDLKSTDEQEAIITRYQAFLNSIDFPIQILISSRKLNMKNYLDFLEKKEKVQPNELLRIQLSEYRNFINQLVSVSNIMEKKFYVIVPFSPMENQKKGFLNNLTSLINPRRNILENRENFETYKNQLLQRVDHVTFSLSGIGLRLATLKTEELIELLFDSYNPGTFNAVEIADTTNLDLSK